MSMPEVHVGPIQVIWRLLRMEHGVRKCARIMLFMNRQQLIHILVGLPSDILIAISREMAKLKGQLRDINEEREKIRNELGALAEVLDFSSPERLGHESFEFLDDVDPRALVELASELDPQTLATLVCHCSRDAALEMLAQYSKEREPLVEELTRQREISTDEIKELAQVTKDSLEEAYERLKKKKGVAGTRVIRKGLTSLLKTQDKKSATKGNSKSRKSSKTQPLGTNKDKETTASLTLEDLILTVESNSLQKIIGSVPAEMLALALCGSSERLGSLIRTNLSSTRLEDVAAETTHLDGVSPEECSAARRAIAKRIQQAI